MVSFEGYTGFNVESPGMIDVFGQIYDYAYQGQPIIMFGPSGSGKEYLAKYYYEQYKLHSGSTGEFLSLNCAGLSKDLAQSELFGHVKGAFTGAENDKVGLIEKAKHGVLFLDEIGDLDENVQTMLLRALGQGKREGRKLGDVKNFTITNTLIICATERNKNVLRDSFLFRLGFQINVLGLNDRPEDVNNAIIFFLRKAILKRRDSKKVLALVLGRDESGLDKNSIKDPKIDLFLEELASHLTPLVKARDWPGNFRALRTAIDSGMIRAKRMSSVKAFIEDIKKYFNIHVGDYSLSTPGSPTSTIQTQNAAVSVKENKWADIISRFFKNLNSTQKAKLISFFTEYEDGNITCDVLKTYLGESHPRSSQIRLKKLADEGVLIRYGIKTYDYKVNKEFPDFKTGQNLPSFLQLPEAPAKNSMPEKTIEALDLIENLNGLFISNSDQNLRAEFLAYLGGELQKINTVMFYSLRKGSVQELIEICIDHLIQLDHDGWYVRSQSSDFLLVNKIIGISGFLNQLLPRHKKTILILDGIDMLKSNEEQAIIENLLYYWYPVRFIFGTDKQNAYNNPSSLVDLMELTL